MSEKTLNLGNSVGKPVIKLKSRTGRLAKSELYKNRWYYLIALPGLLFFFIFCYLPLPGLVIAFKNYNFTDGIFKSPWVGFDNFKFFFESQYAAVTTFNTLFINFNNILFGTLFAVGFAVILNEIKQKFLKKTYQSLMFLTYFFSAVVVSRFVYIVFSENYGIANKILQFFGASPVSWYTEPKYWVPILVGTYIWKNTGYAVIIYLAVIVGIDNELFESAMLDGAGKLQQIRYIILPLLVPTIIILTLLAIGRMFYGDFQTIYAIIENNGLLFPTTNVIDTYVFRAIRDTCDFSMASAVGLYQSVVGFILVLFSNLAVKKYNPDYSLF